MTEMIHETLDIKTEPLFTPETVYGKRMQAVCEYHGLTLKAFLFASDCLGTEEWHNELLGTDREWDMQIKCFLLALDLALQH